MFALMIHLHPTDDQWRSVPPVVGVLANGNDPKDIRWTVEREIHSPDDNQTEYINVHAIQCTRGKLGDGKSICDKCD